jgi:phenylalanyl-tRNA synthetase beta chain
MKVVWSWLREFVAVEVEPEEVADRLSLGALKVEGVERLGAGIEGIVVGSVVKVDEVPGADKVVLVTVDTGMDVRDIVCGARNYGPGDKVPVALPGARLPGGIEIGERTFRGVTSHGMLCSARELGLSDDHSGILVLRTEAALGTDVRTVLGLNEVVLDVEVTPNRADAMSVAGVAREVAALYGLPLTIPAPVVRDEGSPAASIAGVTVRDKRGCPRYLARIITRLRNGASPDWMQRRLTAAGMRPVSAVVDVTNYVLLERGHPTHAFDLGRLSGPTIVVRKARKGERMTTLDDVERVFAPEDLLICDAKRPVAVAGVMGGADAEVSPETTDVLLESAYFAPERVARTARRLGLRTEASVRFERGVDPNGPYAAAERVCELLVEVCGGSVAEGLIDASARIPARKPIRLRTARAAELIGAPLGAGEMTALLRSVSMEVTTAGRTALRVTPPSFRPDVAIEEDLVEEIVRLYGYDRIPETLPAGARTGGLSSEQMLRRLVRRIFLGCGLNEAQTLSLLSPTVPDRFGLPPDHGWRRLIRLANPLSEEESVLRPSLLPGLLLAAERNAARRLPDIALFEIGVTFDPTWHDDRSGRLPLETMRAAFVLAGTSPGGWHGERAYDIFDSKGILDAIASGIGATAPSFVTETYPELHPGRSAAVRVGETVIGLAGELHPRIARTLDLAGRVAVGEIDLEPLFASVAGRAALDLPRFPSADRDLAVVVSETTSAGDVTAAITQAAGETLESLTLFDVYRGEQIGAGNVSLAYRLAFRHPERTLTDEDVAGTMDSVLEAVRARGWRTRD